MILINQLQYKKKIIFNFILFFIFLVFFSRILVAFGLFDYVNHFHYFLLLIIFFLSFQIEIFKNRKENLILVLFFFLILFSSFINSVSILNYIVYNLIIFEPFVYFIVLTNLLNDDKNYKIFEKLIFLIFIIHISLAYIQYILFGLRNDFVQGLFIGLGNGSHAAGSVALIFAIYIYLKNKNISIFKFFLILILFSVNYISDAKQVIFAFITTIIIFLFSNFVIQKKIQIKLKYLFFLTLLITLFQYLYNSFFLSEIISNRNLDDFLISFSIKNKVIEIINSSNSLINFLFGNGVGHSSSRLSFMIPYYENVLPLSKLDLTEKIWFFQQSNYVTNTTTGSSMFSLFFFWGGLYGDLGLLGIIIYLGIWLKIIRNSFNKNLTFFFVTYIFVMGYLYNWIEEPVFIISVISIICLLNKNLNN